jgi:hypothetical protein
MSETPPATPEVVIKLDISEAMGELFKNALAPNLKPVSVAYVDDAGKPQISHRGTTQRLNSKQLAIWARNPEGGIVSAMASKPAIVLHYSDFTDLPKRVYLSVVGRGHVEPDEAIRHTVFDNSPELERSQDPDRKGVAIVIDVDEINGVMDGKILQMRA